MRVAKRLAGFLIVVWVVSVWPVRALALDPALNVSQYGHTAWKIRDGFARGTILSLAQTPDGYLWLGSDSGLSRFDGIRTVPWQPPAGTLLPDNRIHRLLAARDGTLWIGTYEGLASRNGSALTTYPRLDGRQITALVQDREGTVWVAARSRTIGMLCAIQGTKSECHGEDGSLGTYIGPLLEASDGSLWAGAKQGVWRWKPGAPKLYPMPDKPGVFQSMSETASGAILALAADGIWLVDNEKVEAFSLPSMPQNVRLQSLLYDRDGALWIGTTNAGLLHFHQGRIDHLEHSDGLSGDWVVQLFEDREGNVWVATRDGIDRFRALPAATYSAGEGLSHGVVSVLADSDGGIWFSTISGMYRWRDGRMVVYRAQSEAPSPERSPALAQAATGGEIIVSGLPDRGIASLFQSRRGRIWLGSRNGLGYLENDHFTEVHDVPDGYVDSIDEDGDGNIWIAHRDAGLLRVATDLSVQQMDWAGGNQSGDAWRLAVDPVHGGVWLGSFSGGVKHFVDGRLREAYAAADGLGRGAVNHLRAAGDGTVWAATDGGLSRIKDGHIATLNGKNGLPCDASHASIEDDESSTRIYTACGMARIARRDLDAWAAAADQSKAPQSVRMEVLDDIDGVRSYGTPGNTYSPHLTKAPDGRLWLTAPDGVTMVDPRNLRNNPLPPPVHVEQIVADRKAYDMSSPVRLPPRVRDLQIDYTALSLVAPEKIRFRYRLEGRDRDWQDAGNRRQAFYTDLDPGDYRFRVIASNNSGVWNEQGATLAISIAPAYWQTRWFAVLSVVACATLLGAAYRMRVRNLARTASLARETEERQHEVRIELAHANRLATMGQLTASLAHEVNQPLSAAVTNAQAALRWLTAQPPDLAEIRDALDAIVRAGNRASEIVARVRGMVKKTPVQEGDVSLNEEIMGVVALTQGEAVKHRIAIGTEFAPDLPIVRGDRVQLQQVLLNLIVNAIEAMSTLADGKRELVISSENRDSTILVSVCDTGPGLEQAALEQLFQPFFTTKQTGLGMGLAICQSIIEAHGGQLSARENLPRGAIFQFELPSHPVRPNVQS